MKKRTIIISFLLLFLTFFTSCSKVQTMKQNYQKKEQYNLVRGINAMDQGKTEEALKYFIDAYSQNPNNVFTLKQIAYIYSEINEEKKAEEFYLKILQRTPTDGITLHNLGLLYYKQKKYNESLIQLNKILKKSMNDEIIKLKIYNYYLLKEYQKSYLESQKILKKEKDIQFLIIYAKILFDQKKISEFHPYIMELYKNNPENYVIIDLYAKHLWKDLGKTNQAIKLYKDYIIKNGAEKPCILAISNIFYEEKDYIDAKKYMELILEQNLFDKDVLHLKVKIYQKLGLKKDVKEIEKMLSYEKE